MAVQEYRYASWWILFGTGELVHFEDYKPFTNEEDGTQWVKFYMTIPNDSYIKAKYDLKYGDEINPQNGMMEHSYKREHVRFLLVHPEMTRVFIKCDPLGGKTSETDETIDKDTEITSLRKRLRSLNAQIYSLNKENDMIRNKMSQKLKRDVRMLDQVTKHDTKMPMAGDQQNVIEEDDQ